MPTPEQLKMLEAAMPSVVRNLLVYQAIEEKVRREFGCHADAMENITRASAIMHAFALEQHAIYTQRVALVAMPAEVPPGTHTNGSSGKPS